MLSKEISEAVLEGSRHHIQVFLDRLRVLGLWCGSTHQCLSFIISQFIFNENNNVSLPELKLCIWEGNGWEQGVRKADHYTCRCNQEGMQEWEVKWADGTREV